MDSKGFYYMNAVYGELINRISEGFIVLGETMQDYSLGFLNREQLTKLKLKAMRRGVWFRALPRIDRVLIDLTIKIGKNVRSSKLATCILKISRKLQEILESRLARATREIGLPLAHKVSQFAIKWGNVSALDWLTDWCFAKFLAVMHLNEHRQFKP